MEQVLLGHALERSVQALQPLPLALAVMLEVFQSLEEAAAVARFRMEQPIQIGQ